MAKLFLFSHQSLVLRPEPPTTSQHPLWTPVVVAPGFTGLGTGVETQPACADSTQAQAKC